MRFWKFIRNRLCETIIFGIPIALIVALIVWFGAKVIGVNIDYFVGFRFSYIVLFFGYYMFGAIATMWISYLASTHEVTRKDMLEAMSVHKMDKMPGFKKLRGQAFMDVLNRKRAVRKLSGAIVASVFPTFRR